MFDNSDDEWLKIRRESRDLCRKIIDKLSARGETLCFAESCTGGGLSAIMAEVPGASAVMRGGIVAYDPAVKRNILGVPPYFLDGIGVVSRETAIAMAVGAERRLEADWGIAATGYAGPSGGDCRYPVGTVCMAVVRRKQNPVFWTEARHFDGQRIIVVAKAARFVLHAAYVALESRN